jgi:predicted phosphohydrolase
MKLRFVSDLHLEFNYEPEVVDSFIPHMDTDSETILALLGDIHVGKEVVPYLDEMSKRFKYVIYILGNHEFYNNKFYDLKNQLLDKTFHIPNLHIIEDGTVILDGQKFVGCTLWSDMEGGREGSILNVGKGLNDYFRIMGTDGRRLTTKETINAHEYSIEYLKKYVDEDTVVLTHHAPSIGLSDPQFKNSPIKGGFESDLMDLILETRPKYWLYGHTHFNKGESIIENTTLLSNQLGYIDMGEKLNYNPKLILDI